MKAPTQPFSHIFMKSREVEHNQLGKRMLFCSFLPSLLIVFEYFNHIRLYDTYLLRYCIVLVFTNLRQITPIYSIKLSSAHLLPRTSPHILLLAPLSQILLFQFISFFLFFFIFLYFVVFLS